ncbi:hypothetical protein TTHERM_000557969 (macronuclear) [Tetrahymena thermophila SB210]|uniref:Uncharacterized protein n=1 Tax=Tetrahymena thermophila (strain SB210) TaxID=312017 RepID=W7X5S1_TETTS|nr:hypothetical protein TTHERM_000557969 [Tetrahymena thermophila SB210]EWS72742.1 hypothetical protein TTHERM_000557969 [Tetrahymena thermophila SB210]|eukprot:XP_012654720.1 hypothetical protein TTHERM_000557969 [Tetrahymena thermophila SB210]
MYVVKLQPLVTVHALAQVQYWAKEFVKPHVFIQAEQIAKKGAQFGSAAPAQPVAQGFGTFQKQQLIQFTALVAGNGLQDDAEQTALLAISTSNNTKIYFIFRCLSLFDSFFPP